MKLRMRMRMRLGEGDFGWRGDCLRLRCSLQESSGLNGFGGDSGDYTSSPLLSSNLQSSPNSQTPQHPSHHFQSPKYNPQIHSSNSNPHTNTGNPQLNPLHPFFPTDPSPRSQIAHLNRLKQQVSKQDIRIMGLVVGN